MGIFHPDNLFFRALARLVDLVGLSLLWSVCCIPLVTIIPATAALYHVLYRVFRKKDEERAFLLFFRSLRQNLRQGIPSSLICLAVGWALYIVYQWLYYFALLDSDGVVLFVCFSVLLVVPGGMACWLGPLLGRFHFTVGALFSTAAKLVFRHLPSSVVMTLLTLELARLVPELLWVPLLIVPSLWALLTSLFTERVFEKYLPKEDELSLSGGEE